MGAFRAAKMNAQSSKDYAHLLREAGGYRFETEVAYGPIGSMIRVQSIEDPWRF